LGWNKQSLAIAESERYW